MRRVHQEDVVMSDEENDGNDKVIRLVTNGEMDQRWDHDEALHLLETAISKAKALEATAAAVVLVTPEGDVLVKGSRSSMGHHLIAGSVYLQRELVDDMD